MLFCIFVPIRLALALSSIVTLIQQPRMCPDDIQVGLKHSAAQSFLTKRKRQSLLPTERAKLSPKLCHLPKFAMEGNLPYTSSVMSLRH
jgi:hypothetical protein